jgi:hypothetical protein
MTDNVNVPTTTLTTWAVAYDPHTDPSHCPTCGSPPSVCVTLPTDLHDDGYVPVSPDLVGDHGFYRGIDEELARHDDPTVQRMSGRSVYGTLLYYTFWHYRIRQPKPAEEHPFHAVSRTRQYDLAQRRSLAAGGYIPYDSSTITIWYVPARLRRVLYEAARAAVALGPLDPDTFERLAAALVAVSDRVLDDATPIEDVIAFTVSIAVLGGLGGMP